MDGSKGQTERIPEEEERKFPGGVGTSHAGLAVVEEFYHGLGMQRLLDEYLPQPEGPRGYKARGGVGHWMICGC